MMMDLDGPPNEAKPKQKPTPPEKDFAALRPFDPELARSGALITDCEGKCVWSFIAGPDARCRFVLRIESGSEANGEFTYPCNPETLRMAPLAWVQVSTSNTTLRPIYIGDQVWHSAGGIVTATGRHPNGCDGFEFTVNKSRNGIARRSWGAAYNMLCQPPTVKAEGWINIYPDRMASHIIHPDKAAADKEATDLREACVKIMWDRPVQ